MSYASMNQIGKFGRLSGQFTNKETGKVFDYVDHQADDFTPLFVGPYGHLVRANAQIFVGPDGDDTRFAYVGKSVVYVVVDEVDAEDWVVEKWAVKGSKRFSL